jgi:2-methylcitrate dehydratase PrpD
VPAVLAAGEAAGRSGLEALVAAVAASEIVARLGMAATGTFHGRGFHPTSVCGVFGAAAAAARLEGADVRGTVNALGIAGSLAGGLFEYLADGSATKPIHAGAAAESGIQAARLAARGATGPASVLEGRYGLYAAFADLHGVDLEAALADLGERWETPRIAFKPYPACHFIHAPLDAVAALVREHGLRSADVREIVVHVPAPGVPLVCEPLAEKRAPRTPYDAKFSLPFAIGALFADGEVGVATYSAAKLADRSVIEVAAKVRHEPRDFPTFPRSFPGAARIVLADGRTVEATVDAQRGGAESPMTPAEVAAKFRANAALALPEAAVARLEDAVLGLDGARTLAPVAAILADAAPRR